MQRKNTLLINGWWKSIVPPSATTAELKCGNTDARAPKQHVSAREIKPLRQCFDQLIEINEQGPPGTADFHVSPCGEIFVVKLLKSLCHLHNLQDDTFCVAACRSFPVNQVLKLKLTDCRAGGVSGLLPTWKQRSRTFSSCYAEMLRGEACFKIPLPSLSSTSLNEPALFQFKALSACLRCTAAI